MNRHLAVTNQSEEYVQFIVFDVVKSISDNKTLTMALNVQKIKGVVELNEVSPLPEGMENILGLYDLRGCPIPVLDIVSLLTAGKKTTSFHPESRLIICDLQNVFVGIPVMKTRRIVTVLTNEFLPPPPLSRLSHQNLITGIFSYNGKFVPVLDLDSILTKMGFENESSVIPKFREEFEGKKILVVDDSKIILKKLSQLFSQLGFDVTQAINGEEGLDKIAKNENEEHKFDLVFTDIEMPIMDGMAMVRALKNQYQHFSIPVLFNSALSNPALIEEIESQGLGHYLVKFDSDLIIRHLENIFIKK